MAISTHSKKGQRILEYLKKELDLPPKTIGFELHIKLDEPITVRNLDYYPLENQENKD